MGIGYFACCTKEEETDISKDILYHKNLKNFLRGKLSQLVIKTNNLTKLEMSHSKKSIGNVDCTNDVHDLKYPYESEKNTPLKDFSELSRIELLLSEIISILDLQILFLQDSLTETKFKNKNNFLVFDRGMCYYYFIIWIEYN